MKRYKKIISIALVIISVLLLAAPVFASSLDQTNNGKTHEVTFKFDKPQNLILSGSLFIFYSSDTNVLYAELNNENNWTQTVDVTADKYVLYQNAYNNPQEVPGCDFLTEKEINVNKDMIVSVYLSKDGIVEDKNVKQENLSSANEAVQMARLEEQEKEELEQQENIKSDNFTVTEQSNEINNEDLDSNKFDFLNILPFICLGAVFIVFVLILIDRKRIQNNQNN